MTTKKIIEVSGDDLVMWVLNMTVADFQKSGIKTNSKNVKWTIESDYVKKVTVEIIEQ